MQCCSIFIWLQQIVHHFECLKIKITHFCKEGRGHGVTVRPTDTPTCNCVHHRDTDRCRRRETPLACASRRSETEDRCVRGPITTLTTPCSDEPRFTSLLTISGCGGASRALMVCSMSCVRLVRCTMGLATTVLELAVQARKRGTERCCGAGAEICRPPSWRETEKTHT